MTVPFALVLLPSSGLNHRHYIIHRGRKKKNPHVVPCTAQCSFLGLSAQRHPVWLRPSTHRGSGTRVSGEQWGPRPGPLFSARTCLSPTPPPESWGRFWGSAGERVVWSRTRRWEVRVSGERPLRLDSLPQASSGLKPSPIPQAPPPGCSEPSVTCALHECFGWDSDTLYGTGLVQDGVSVPLQATHSYAFRKRSAPRPHSQLVLCERRQGTPNMNSSHISGVHSPCIRRALLSSRIRPISFSIRPSGFLPQHRLCKAGSIGHRSVAGDVSYSEIVLVYLITLFICTNTVAGSRLSTSWAPAFNAPQPGEVGR